MPGVGISFTPNALQKISNLNIVNVADFGAGGDPTQDDTPYLQMAYDYLTLFPDGGMLWFPPGSSIYLKTGGIKVQPGLGPVTFWGYGSTVYKQNIVEPFITLNSTAVDDTFDGITVSGFLLDCVDAINGQDDYLIGAPNNLHINISNITMNDVRMIFMPNRTPLVISGVTIYPARSAISLTTRHTGPNESPNYIKNIRIDNVQAYGADIGVKITGEAPYTGGAAQRFVHITIDNVQVNNFYHDASPSGTGSYTGYYPGQRHVWIGDKAYGTMPCRVQDVTGQYSGDHGIEIDSLDTVSIQDCSVLDAKTYSYYFHEWNLHSDIELQLVKFSNCRIKWHDVIQASKGFKIGATSNAVGSFSIGDCSCFFDGLYAIDVDTKIIDASDISTSISFNISGLRVDCGSFGHEFIIPDAGGAGIPWWIIDLPNPSKAVIENCSLDFTGSYNDTPPSTIGLVRFGGYASYYYINNLKVDISLNDLGALQVTNLYAIVVDPNVMTGSVLDLNVDGLAIGNFSVGATTLRAVMAPAALVY